MCFLFWFQKETLYEKMRLCIIVAVCCAILMKRYHWMIIHNMWETCLVVYKLEKKCSRRCKWFVKRLKRIAWFPHLLMPINKQSKEVSADPLLTDWPTFVGRDSIHWIVTFQTLIQNIIYFSLSSVCKSTETHFKNSCTRKDQNTAIGRAVWKQRCILFLPFFLFFFLQNPK